MKPCVYILRCSNERYYIGSTQDFLARYKQHSSGLVKSTKNLCPLELAFLQSYEILKEARKIGYWLKRQKDRNLIEKL